MGDFWWKMHRDQLSMRLYDNFNDCQPIADLYERCAAAFSVPYIVAFYVLALLLDFSFPEGRFDLSKAATLLGYGFLIESVQYLLPYRTFSLFDLSADAVGLLVYTFSLPALKYIPWLRWRWRILELKK